MGVTRVCVTFVTGVCVTFIMLESIFKEGFFVCFLLPLRNQCVQSSMLYSLKKFFLPLAAAAVCAVSSTYGLGLRAAC